MSTWYKNLFGGITFTILVVVVVVVVISELSSLSASLSLQQVRQANGDISLGDSPPPGPPPGPPFDLFRRVHLPLDAGGH